jgi:AAA domain
MTEEIKNPELELLAQLGIQGLTNAETITNTDRLKVAVCGEKKSGKSKLIADTARKPLLHYDFDDRRESIAGAKNTIIKTLVDSDSTMPQAWGILESDLSSLEYAKKNGSLPIKSLALDSATYLRQIAENQMMHDTSLMRYAKIGLTRYQISQGWDAINYVHRMLYQLLRRMFALDIDIYVVFHTRNEKDRVKSTKEETFYTDRLTVDPQNLDVLLPMFNETWRAFVDSDGNFKLQVRQDWRFNASTALKIGQDGGIVDPNIEALLEQNAKNGNKTNQS